MVGFQKRFSPVFQRARELIQQNAVGELIFYRAYFFSSDVLREGHAWRFRGGSGGVLLDLAPHLLDILTWFFGEPATITASTRRVYSRDVDDYVHAAMSHESGLHGHVDVCWSTSNFRLPEISIEVHGKNGMLTVKDDFVKISLGKEARETGEGRVYYRQSFNTSVPFLLADAEYTMEDLAFLDAVRKGYRHQSNFAEAAKVNDIIDRILASAHERRG
jgi:predicted dehydrogenase